MHVDLSSNLQTVLWLISRLLSTLLCSGTRVAVFLCDCYTHQRGKSLFTNREEPDGMGHEESQIWQLIARFVH